MFQYKMKNLIHKVFNKFFNFKYIKKKSIFILQKFE